ncbi:MAG: hypothetical protein HQ582_08330 [Planctomycetes bacterium]|nr:hypothetical protein [Planctomycetota bacterium]
MANFDGTDRQACASAIRELAGEECCNSVDLAALEPAHLAAIAEIARRLDGLADVERWQFGVILPELAANPEVSAQLAASSGNLAGPVGEMLDGELDRVIRGAVPAVAAAIGAEVALDRTAAADAVVNALRDGKRGQEIAEALAARVREAPKDTIVDFDSWGRRTAAETFAALRPQLLAVLPEECSLTESTCVDALESLLREKISVEETTQSFGEQFARKPEAFIEGYDGHLRKQAEAVYEQLKPGLKAEVSDLTLDDGACVNTLVELMRSRTPPEKLVETFAARVRSQPKRFFKGYAKLLEKQATALCGQITAQLSKQLPAGALLKHSACLALVRRLLGENHPPSTLVARFMEEFQANVKTYVEPIVRHTGRPISGSPSPPTSSSGREMN